MEHYRFVNNTTCFLVLCDIWNSTVMLYSNTDHCVKIVRVRSYSDPLFYAFGLNIERYYVSLRIQSECGKMRTRITPNTDPFYAVKVTSLIVILHFSFLIGFFHYNFFRQGNKLHDTRNVFFCQWVECICICRSNILNASFFFCWR